MKTYTALLTGVLVFTTYASAAVAGTSYITEKTLGVGKPDSAESSKAEIASNNEVRIAEARELTATSPVLGTGKPGITKSHVEALDSAPSVFLIKLEVHEQQLAL